tara:strand:- start:4590 stop:5093 length:504 start_codon:yes stop_codon:yes gene_type:complete
MTINTLTVEQNKLLKMYNNRFIVKSISIAKLPMAFFAGLKIEYINEYKSITSVKFGYLTKNPYRSTYFAVLSMAAELSTGLLANLYVTGIKPSIALIVTKLNASFIKKAIGTTTFVCEDGQKFQEAIEILLTQRSPAEVKSKSTGLNESGEIIAEFEIYWSFKQRQH